ncbi:MAG: glycosyltransferase family 4 protein [Nevskia sp.]|nr:glycosyltransferase family 4 protein [Nevskia sp.]
MHAADMSSPQRARPRRLVFVNRYFYPDVSATSQILFDLTSRLARSGLDVHVVCSRQLYEDSRANLPGRDSVEGIQVHRIRTARFGRARLAGRAIDYLSFYAACAGYLPRLLRRGDVLVAKTDPPLISVVAAAAARLRGAALVNWLQDVFPEVASQLEVAPLPPWLYAALRRIRDGSLRAAHTNVALGLGMRDFLIGRRIAEERIRVIENWADQDAIRTMPAQASELRRSLGLQDRFVVGYSGNLGRAHDYRTILDAASALAPNPRIVFLMVGGGANMTRLKEEAGSRQLTNLLFLPYQPRASLSDSLAAADIHLACLLPELEGLIVPSKFYGILAVERPVVYIGKPDGELAGIIGTAGCGAVVSCGDGAALAETLLKLQADPAKARAMGLRARKLFVETYTVDRATSQWLDLLREIG